ncbi:hypothetical protein Tco_0086708 [Tanacetum coccineum]
MEQSCPKAWTRFKDLLQKVPHYGIDLWLQVQIFYDHVNPIIRRTINQSAGGKLYDLKPQRNPGQQYLRGPASMKPESENDTMDCVLRPVVKGITLPQDSSEYIRSPSKSDAPKI